MLPAKRREFVETLPFLTLRRDDRIPDQNEREKFVWFPVKDYVLSSNELLTHLVVELLIDGV